MHPPTHPHTKRHTHALNIAVTCNPPLSPKLFAYAASILLPPAQLPLHAHHPPLPPPLTILASHLCHSSHYPPLPLPILPHIPQICGSGVNMCSKHICVHIWVLCVWVSMCKSCTVNVWLYINSRCHCLLSLHLCITAYLHHG